MNRAEWSLPLIAAGIASLSLAAGAGMSAVADDEPEGRHGKEKMRIVVIDDSGNRQEEVFEFDEDHPRPFLGVTLSKASGGGARVEQVVPDSGAERAGLREGDVIVGIEGNEVERPWDLTSRVLRFQPGDRVDLDVTRDGVSRTVTVELGQGGWLDLGGNFDLDELGEQLGRLDEQLEGLDLDFEWDSDTFQDSMRRLHDGLEGLDFSFDLNFGGDERWFGATRPKLGVELVEATPELREHLGAAREEGVLVGRLLPGLPAETSGVQVGDLIVAVDGEPIEDAGDLRRALRDASGRTIELEVVRDKRSLTLQVFIPESKSDDEGERSIRFRRPHARPVPVVDPSRKT